MTQRPISRATLVRTFFLAIVCTAVAFPAVFSPAGAAEGCGQYSYGFAGTRLINDGISTSAGPYGIDLPAGTYTVTLVAHDHHDTQVNAASQPGEQYVVVLNSGYTSPPSTDIADDATITTTTFTGQRLAASTSVTVQHAGAAGINSVDVVCVGFTPEAGVQPVVEIPTPPDTTTAPGTTTPPVQDIADPATVVREPVTTAPTTTTTGVVTPEVITPEVKGIVETPPAAAQLALTGPRDHLGIMSILAIAMVGFGTLLVRHEHRLALQKP